MTHHDGRRRTTFPIHPLLATSPTFSNVRTPRLFAHCVQTQSSQIALDLAVAGAGRDLGLEMRWQTWRLEIAHGYTGTLGWEVVTRDKVVEREAVIEARSAGRRGGGRGGRASQSAAGTAVISCRCKRSDRRDASRCRSAEDSGGSSGSRRSR